MFVFVLVWSAQKNLQKELDTENKKDVMSRTVLGATVGYLLGYTEVT